MASFNEIPDYLKSNERTSWTLEKGLVWGAISAVGTAMIFGTALYWVTSRVPGLTIHWLISFVSTFFMTWVLFAVMHRVSGVLHFVGTIVVVAAMVAVGTAKYFAWLAYVASVPVMATEMSSTFEWGTFFLGDFPAWFGLGTAALMCRNGGLSAEDLAELLTLNPLTGGR